ncbi:MAG TPA: Dabb family protein [Nocardioidaceae bacterium]
MSDLPALQHVVLMKFPTALSAAEDAKLRSMVASWPSEIGTMTELRFGGDLTGDRSRGYQYLLLTVFPDADTLAAYVAHPVHQELITFLNERDCERLAFDYYLDDSTRPV